MAQDADAKTKTVLTEDEALEIIAFLFSSAEISLFEPTYYGTIRLVEAASRLMEFRIAHEPEHTADWIRDFKAEIDVKKNWMMWDREAYFDFLKSATATVATEIRRRREDASNKGGGA
jgi:hypothetical protein